MTSSKIKFYVLLLKKSVKINNQIIFKNNKNFFLRILFFSYLKKQNEILKNFEIRKNLFMESNH